MNELERVLWEWNNLRQKGYTTPAMNELLDQLAKAMESVLVVAHPRHRSFYE